MEDKYKNKIKVVAIAIVVLLGFGYAGYFVWGEVVSARMFYIDTYRELLSLEKKQDLIADLKEELSRTERNREEILSALLLKEETLFFIIRIEDLARKAGLSYEVRILKETTKESIAKENLAIARSSRGKLKRAEEALKGNLPGILFSIEMEGSYFGVIRFLEGIASLPYYTNIESFNIASKSQEESLVIFSSIQFMVFTK